MLGQVIHFMVDTGDLLVILTQVQEHQCAFGERKPAESAWGDEGCVHDPKVPGHDAQPGIWEKELE